MSFPAGICEAERHEANGIGIRCQLPLGHVAPHWALLVQSYGAFPTAWHGDDRESSDPKEANHG